MSKGKILVVEDERDIREGLCEFLVKDGYDVTACGDMQEAEKIIAHGGVDLYLLDVMLPDGSGFELCEHIRDGLGSGAPRRPRSCAKQIFMPPYILLSCKNLNSL